MQTLHNARNQLAAEVSAQTKWVQAVSLSLETAADARHFQQAIEAELRTSGTRRVLVDARKAILSSAEVNESMWRWVRSSQSFDLLAIVNQSSVLTVAAQMKATSIGIKKVKVFHSFFDAARWLGARVPEE
jgi:hypothetical protein